MAEKNPDEIGALWLKSSERGEYMTGTIDGKPVVVFRNTRKTGNQPDWRVLKSKPRTGAGARTDRAADEPDRAEEPGW